MNTLLWCSNLIFVVASIEDVGNPVGAQGRYIKMSTIYFVERKHTYIQA